MKTIIQLILVAMLITSCTTASTVKKLDFKEGFDNASGKLLTASELNMQLMNFKKNNQEQLGDSDYLLAWVDYDDLMKYLLTMKALAKQNGQEMSGVNLVFGQKKKGSNKGGNTTEQTIIIHPTVFTNEVVNASFDPLCSSKEAFTSLGWLLENANNPDELRKRCPEEGITIPKGAAGLKASSASGEVMTSAMNDFMTCPPAPCDSELNPNNQ